MPLRVYWFAFFYRVFHQKRGKTMCENQVKNTIEATLVANEQRLAFLPRHLGDLLLRFESTVYL